MKLEKIILLGHSFGGYISSIYSMKYPDRILHLILDDPWGFPQIPEPGTGIFENIPKWKIRLFKILTSFNPLSALRAAGPWGKFAKIFSPLNFVSQSKGASILNVSRKSLSI